MDPLTSSFTQSRSVQALIRQSHRYEKRHMHRLHASIGKQGDDGSSPRTDPEARFRRFGKDFGKWPRLDFAGLMQSAPRVRVRRCADRQRDQLAELAVLNNRLAGNEAWEARKKLEYLKTRRKNWEKIYNYITCKDAEATLSMIEEANRKVEDALSEEARERVGVGALKRRLVELQAEVGAAHSRLHLTQARVDANVVRISSLRAEAARLERIQSGQAASTSSGPSTTGPPSATVQDLLAASAAEPRPAGHLDAAAALVHQGPSEAAETAPKRSKRAGDRRGLASSLEMEPGLRDFWYPVHFSAKLQADTLVPVELFGEPWVVFRDENGQPACVKDECAHRACPLSLGKVTDGQVQCPYHGWTYNAEGVCTAMPSTVQCSGVTVNSLPCMETDGFVWIWPGYSTPGPMPDFARPPKGFEVHAEIEVDVEVEHGLLLENLLDLAHAPFTHTSTFARGWPIPDFVKFQATRLLSGNWDPYPINMAFQPPCMVLSLIGLAQPGKILRGQRAEECANHLHQLHVCLPSRRGHTRLLYRMSLDFMHWTRLTPGIGRLWYHIAGQVLGEDLVLVKGQQERMLAGSDTWAHPVSYDKLAVRYRRWRNSVDAAPEVQKQATRMVQQTVSAGELFNISEDDLECDVESSGCV